MNQKNIEEFAEKVDALLVRFESINNENNQLRQQVTDLRAERDRLSQRNEAARKQIDTMISRLKSI